MTKGKYHSRALIKNIAFFGDSEAKENDPSYKDAYEIAKMLAQEGFTIVNGGGAGIMNASSRGAEDGGGETIAVTFSPQDAPGFEGKYVGNIVDKEIKTENYIERMFKLLEHADMFIIFRGGSGTISELGTAWVLAKLYYGHHKPFILYGNFWLEIIDVIRKSMHIDKEELRVFEIVSKKEEILPTIKRFERKLREVNHGADCKVCVDRAFKN